MKQLCSRCKFLMNHVKSYEGYDKKNKNAYITNKDGRKKMVFDIEEHQCQNEKCKDYGEVKCYKIDGFSAKEISKKSFEIL